MKKETYNSLPIILPKKKSRPVELSDLWTVLRDSIRIKIAMLRPFPGRYPFAASIGHSQIEANDPLRFFVVDREWMNGKSPVRLSKFFGARTIINPVITWRGSVMMKSKEGCMSYADKKLCPVRRNEKIELEYWTFFGKRKRMFYLFRSCIIQHELDHFDCVDIYQLWKHKK